MARVDKYTATEAAAVCKHDRRAQGDGTFHSNETIDDSKTDQNYNLAETDQPLDTTEFMQKRLSECIVYHRADVNVLCSWAVTLPKDYTGDERKFFEKTYIFLCERYGKENVVSAWVHKDEKTPHMHFKFVPITQVKTGKNKGKYKLCAAEVINVAELRMFHRDLQSYLETALQCPCNILNGATASGAKTVQELKTEQLLVQNETLDKEINTATNELQTILNKKLQAAKIKPKLFGKTTQEYDKAMIDDIVAICQSVDSEFNKTTNMLQEIIAKEAKLKAEQVQTDRLNKLAQQRYAQEEQKISVAAQDIAEKALKQTYVPETSEFERMKNFMKTISLPTGVTALEQFNRNELMLKHNIESNVRDLVETKQYDHSRESERDMEQAKQEIEHDFAY